MTKTWVVPLNPAPILQLKALIRQLTQWHNNLFHMRSITIYFLDVHIKMKMETADRHRIEQLSTWTIYHTKCFPPHCESRWDVCSSGQIRHGVNSDPREKASETAKWLEADCLCFKCHISATVSGVLLRQLNETLWNPSSFHLQSETLWLR